MSANVAAPIDMTALELPIKCQYYGNIPANERRLTQQLEDIEIRLIYALCMSYRDSNVEKEGYISMFLLVATTVDPTVYIAIDTM
jgi:hypothetical protein